MDNFPNIGASGEDVDNFVDSFEDFTEGTTENNPDLDGSNDEFAEFEDATFEPATDLPEQSSGSTLNNLNFDSMDNKSLTEALCQVLDNIFPVTNTTPFNEHSTNVSGDKGLASVFITPTSLEIWKQISDESDKKLFQWKRSIIRKEFYSNLGIKIDALEDMKSKYIVNSTTTTSVTLPSKPINPIPTSNKAVTLSAPVSRSSTPDPTHNNLSSSSHGNLPKQKISQTQIDEPKQLDIGLARMLCSISEETLQTFTNVQLRNIKSELLSLSSQTSDALTFWLDQREQTIMDSETYNQMIECLVGHAQKIRDGGGIGGGNQAKIGWNTRGIKLMKKGSGTVASGLASLSLPFKKQKNQASQTNSPVTSTSVVADVFKNNRGSNDVYERPLSM